MVAGSTLTRMAARMAGMVGSVSFAFWATRAFHSALVLGTTFQIGLRGLAMIARIWGLTVLGTGMVLAGSCRAPGGSANAGNAARPAINATHAQQPGNFITSPLGRTRNPNTIRYIWPGGR